MPAVIYLEQMELTLVQLLHWEVIIKGVKVRYIFIAGIPKNTWSSSKLNIINLNTNFINALGDNWSSKIAEVAWQVGGMTYSNGYGVNASETYSYEVGINTLNK